MQPIYDSRIEERLARYTKRLAGEVESVGSGVQAEMDALFAKYDVRSKKRLDTLRSVIERCKAIAAELPEDIQIWPPQMRRGA